MTASEMKKNKAAQAELVERVRAELAVACGVRVMEVSDERGWAGVGEGLSRGSASVPLRPALYS